MPAYEFRSKPSKNIEIEGDIRFVLRQGEGVLDFELRAGNFRLENDTVMDVNTPDAKDYFELRIRMVGEEEIWLDTGKIF